MSVPTTLPSPITTFMSRTRTLIPFKLGADPEFVVYGKDKRLVRARDTRFNTPDEEIGGDASGRPFELRPEPSECPLEVVSNLRAILSSHTRRHPSFFEYTWKAGSFHKAADGTSTPIGGHIHVGTHEMDGDEGAIYLDQYIGVASTLLQEAGEAQARMDSGYGAASDWRVQEHGFEYRTCASWLSSPHIAASFLCLTKAVIHQVLNTRKGTESLYQSVDPESINDLDLTDLREHWPAIWKSVEALDLYPTYKAHLDLLNTLVTAKKTWYPKWAMQSAWGIAQPIFHSKHEVTLDSVWGGLGGKVVVKRAAKVDVVAAKAPSLPVAISVSKPTGLAALESPLLAAPVDVAQARHLAYLARRREEYAQRRDAEYDELTALFHPDGAPAIS